MKNEEMDLQAGQAMALEPPPGWEVHQANIAGFNPEGWVLNSFEMPAVAKDVHVKNLNPHQAVVVATVDPTSPRATHDIYLVPALFNIVPPGAGAYLGDVRIVINGQGVLFRCFDGFIKVQD